VAFPAAGAAPTVPVMVTGVQPLADAVMVVVPDPLPAVIVTGCGRFQLLEFSVTELPAVTEIPPPDADTVTPTGLDGEALSDTPMSVEVPAGTVIVGGLSFRLPPDGQLPVGVVVGGAVVGGAVVGGAVVGGAVVGGAVVGGAVVGGGVPVPVPVQVTVAGGVLVPL
jgi:hypothetical protein